MSKTALLVCPEAPFPAVGGGALRTASLATYLGQKYALDLVVFREPGAPDPRLALPVGLVQRALVIDLRAHRKDNLSKVLRNASRYLRNIPPHEDRFQGYEAAIKPWLQDYDLVCLEHFWTTTYFDLLRPRAKRLLCDLHNIESVFYTTRAEVEPTLAPVWRRFAAANLARERERLPRFDQLLVTSATDAARVNLPNTIIYPNAIPLVGVPDVTKEPAIAFSGNLEFPPNRDAVAWFAREVWPRLAREFPALEWHIIGKGERFVQDSVAHLPRIVLTGPVDDAVRELARAQVAVVPVRSGSGTRLKILEAWAARTAVVSTPLGAEGLGAGDAVRLATTTDEFFDAVAHLFTTNFDRERVAERGRGLYLQRFTWPAAWCSLESNEI
ncbi:MAG: glycosyltransferase family 4 protein [Bryobacteraceae bacterium]|nr:glycosyltransferase family 4 protein [Bryobacteraceae bacterium]